MNAVKSEEIMLATVDLGSNSFRLHIAKVVKGNFQVMDSLKEMVRLAGGLDAQKMLSQDAQQRACACLARFGERLQQFHPDHVRVVATNTFRVARNIKEFLPRAEAALGFPIEIIAGREEARLIYTGVVHTLPFQEKTALVVDIGGGSTEFVIGRTREPDITESLSMGCVSYALRFFPDTKVTAEAFRQAVNLAKSEIQRISAELKGHGWDFAVGTSGSARSIRDVGEMLGFAAESITREAMQAMAQRLIGAKSTRQAQLPGLKPDRLEVFADGLAVMTAVFEELNIEEMRVTDAALREGVLYDMLGRQVDDDMRHQTCAQFQERYQVDLAQAERVRQIALQCLSGFGANDHKNATSFWQPYVNWAAKLHEIGLSIAHSGYHKHGAYILENADMPGFSRKDQSRLALLVLGHRGDLKKMLALAEEPGVWAAVFSLRLAALFCRSRMDMVFPPHSQLYFDAKKNRCQLYLGEQWLKDYPLSASALAQEIEQWRKIDFSLELKTF